MVQHAYFCLLHKLCINGVCVFVLAYAFAELIDNALSATSQNPGVRNLDIRLVSTNGWVISDPQCK